MPSIYKVSLVESLRYTFIWSSLPPDTDITVDVSDALLSIEFDFFDQHEFETKHCFSALELFANDVFDDAICVTFS